MSDPTANPNTLRPGQVVVHWLRGDDGACAGDPAVLHEEERLRAASFRFDADRERWIRWRTGLRRILGSYLDLPPASVPLVTGPHGKPLLAPPLDHWHFNLSHATDWAVLAIGRDGPVGIDLEPLDRASSLDECVSSFCHPLEISALANEPPTARPLRLLELWTAKEALLKALGTGMTFPPDAFSLDGLPGTPLRPPFSAFRLFSPATPPAHHLALAAPLTTKEVTVVGA